MDKGCKWCRMDCSSSLYASDMFCYPNSLINAPNSQVPGPGVCFERHLCAR